MTMRVIYLATDVQRARARAAIDEAEQGSKVTIAPAPKTRAQEERYHAMVADIARQYSHCGRLWDAEDMKRLLVAAFRQDTARDPDLRGLWDSMGQVEMAPSLDGTGIVALGWQTRRFPKGLASAFVEWLFAFGVENGIRWSDPATQRAGQDEAVPA